jgi:cytidine deaminase
MRMEIQIFRLVCAEIIITLVAFYKGKNGVLKKANILSFGFNMMGDISGNQPGIHAEHDAINRLKPIRRKKHLQNVNILVVRLSKNNKLQNSKPCANCIENMKILPEKKGYRIRNIYYSNENGEIAKSSLKNLEKEELHYSRFFRQNKNFDIYSI